MLLWVLLVALQGLQLAVCEEDESFALSYLANYHYISPSRSGNHDVKTAIEHFQEFFHLPVTGELDPATLTEMRKPRCGVADVDESGRVRRYATASKWSKKHLTFYLQYGQDLGEGAQDRIFTKSLQYWADVSGLSFSQVSTPEQADIKISFGRYSHGGTSVEQTCPYPFNGPSGVLAHAYFPQDGRAHFDEDEEYTEGTSSGVNLLQVAVHEFGHSLGLQHSNVPGSIMYPTYNGYVPGMTLHQDDINGIQSLYGPNNGGGGGTQPPPEPTTSRPGPQPSTSQPGGCPHADRWHSCQPYKDAGQCEDYRPQMEYWCYKTCYC